MELNFIKIFKNCIEQNISFLVSVDFTEELTFISLSMSITILYVFFHLCVYVNNIRGNQKVVQDSPGDFLKRFWSQSRNRKMDRVIVKLAWHCWPSRLENRVDAEDITRATLLQTFKNRLSVLRLQSRRIFSFNTIVEYSQQTANFDAFVRNLNVQESTEYV